MWRLLQVAATFRMEASAETSQYKVMWAVCMCEGWSRDYCRGNTCGVCGGVGVVSAAKLAAVQLESFNLCDSHTVFNDEEWNFKIILNSSVLINTFWNLSSGDVCVENVSKSSWWLAKQWHFWGPKFQLHVSITWSQNYKQKYSQQGHTCLEESI